jgi:hypothetical protein
VNSETRRGPTVAFERPCGCRAGVQCTRGCRRALGPPSGVSGTDPRACHIGGQCPTACNVQTCLTRLCYLQWHYISVQSAKLKSDMKGK